MPAASSMNLAMSSSRKDSVSLSSEPTVSDQADVAAPAVTRPCTMNPSGTSSEEDVAHAVAIDEGADRAEDLLEVLPGASLVDPHGCSLLRRPSPEQAAPDRMATSRWSGRAAPWSRAWRSLDRKIAVAASVTTAPVTNKATTIVAPSGSGDGCPHGALAADG